MLGSVMAGESTCMLGFVMTGIRSSAMRVVKGESGAVRAMKTDTTGGRKFVFIGWSSNDGDRSQGSNEKGE